ELVFFKGWFGVVIGVIVVTFLSVFFKSLFYGKRCWRVSVVVCRERVVEEVGRILVRADVGNVKIMAIRFGAVSRSVEEVAYSAWRWDHWHWFVDRSVHH